MKIKELLKESVQIDSKLKIDFNNWSKEDLIQAHKNAGYDYDELDALFTDFKFVGVKKSNTNFSPVFAVVSQNDYDSKAGPNDYYVHLMFVGFDEDGALDLDVGQGPIKSDLSLKAAKAFMNSYKLR